MKATTAKKWKWLSVRPSVRCTSTALQLTRVTTAASVRTRRLNTGRGRDRGSEAQRGDVREHVMQPVGVSRSPTHRRAGRCSHSTQTMAR